MYRSTFERAFSDIAPNTSDEEFAQKIMSAAEERKPRRVSKKAVIIPIAAATVLAGTISVSAAGGLDIFGALRQYFSQREVYTLEPSPSADLSAASFTAYDKSFDIGEYTLSINGLTSDANCVYIYFDVTYEDEKYFENGELKAELKEKAPVNFSSDICYTTGWAEGVGVSGNTVSYVQYCEGYFIPNQQTGEYDFSFSCVCVDSASFIYGECNLLKDFTVEASVPPARKREVTLNLEIPLPDGRTSVLEKADFGTFSASFEFNNDYFYKYTFDRSDFKFLLRMKDGSCIDLMYGNSSFSAAEGYSFVSEADVDNAPAATSSPDTDQPAMTTYALTENELAETTTLAEPGTPPSFPGDFGVPCVWRINYAAAIDPDEIEEITIFGETIKLEQQ